MPCLLLANIAADIDLDTLIRLWPMPTLYVVLVILSSSLGAIGGKLLNLTPSVTRFVMTGIIFNNVTSLTLGLLEGIGSTDAINILLRDENDSPKEAVKRGMSYILLATLLGNLSRWSLGTYLLRKESSDEELVISIEHQPLPGFHNDERQTNSLVSEHTPLIFKSIEKKSVNIGVRIMNFVRRALKPIKEIMNPPLYAAIIALIIGTVPFLKGIFFGVDAPLYATLTRTVEQLGKISVPLTLLTLGAQVKTLPSGNTREIIPQISYVMLCRFAIMPIIGTIIIIYTKDYYLADPMFWFILMSMSSGPPAVNCMNLAQLTGNYQGEMATLLFYSYAAVGPLMAILVMAMLSLIEKNK
ncbi:auxin efflux carrier [Glomus cerebriforme]|uniref:Auxin efflux carrier n=2 Tax=Glomus cerebriforme TaxID=658196 RepID=A0A397T6E5_9GLOM|nr:auxin efflux carrier [Glomus cerebriforme]